MVANTTVITKATETIIEGVPCGIEGWPNRGDGVGGCIEGFLISDGGTQI